MAVQEAPVVWDLSDLYSGLEDPAIEADVERLREEASAFEQAYRGAIAAPDCTAERLRGALDVYEQLNRRLARPVAFTQLTFAGDTSNPAHGAALQKMQQAATAVTRHLIFFDLEVGRMPAETFDALKDDERLSEYRHYLEQERILARHHLSEPEEQIIQELNNTGVRAFERLFSEITSRARFRVDLHGGVRELNQSELLALMYDADRETRRAASEGLTAVLRDQSHVLTYIYNNLLQHKATTDRLRGYETPDQSRHENNELPPEVVSNMVEVCVENYDLPARYYKLKRKLLGLSELTHYDRYAPLNDTGARIEFDTARRIVLDSFEEFTPALRELAEPFFTRRWIDAELRAGKRGGAFCSYIAPDVHPFVFLNYTANPRDVMTLAHELGHAVHGLLGGARHNYFSFTSTLPLAETASVFAEILVFEKLQQEMESPREKLALLAGKIEDTLATVFRQATMYRFELAAHTARREEGELTAERYNSLWQSTMQEMFGDALILGEDHRWWWSYIPHIFASPFYVYAYAFGELLVLALYARYREEGQPFVQRYLDLLAAGGSQTPQEMLAAIGIDISNKDFWRGGAALISEMIDRADALAEELG
ncbi:MAG: M3 family oligoendopeptidase [Actinomycetota bacterium]